jgi:hypothetical protein
VQASGQATWGAGSPTEDLIDKRRNEVELERYRVWIKITPYQTTHVYVWARGMYEARLQAEAQYGQGNVLDCTQDRPEEATD